VNNVTNMNNSVRTNGPAPEQDVPSYDVGYWFRVEVQDGKIFVMTDRETKLHYALILAGGRERTNDEVVFPLSQESIDSINRLLKTNITLEQAMKSNNDDDLFADPLVEGTLHSS